jgi:hypothetical protein
MSKTDISHPAHAASQSIATFTLVMGFPPCHTVEKRPFLNSLQFDFQEITAATAP